MVEISPLTTEALLSASSPPITTTTTPAVLVAKLQLGVRTGAMLLQGKQLSALARQKRGK
jgi:hypothetical protein